jgi:hypothetical protein
MLSVRALTNKGVGTPTSANFCKRNCSDLRQIPTLVVRVNSYTLLLNLVINCYFLIYQIAPIKNQNVNTCNLLSVINKCIKAELLTNSLSRRTAKKRSLPCSCDCSWYKRTAHQAVDSGSGTKREQRKQNEK